MKRHKTPQVIIWYPHEHYGDDPCPSHWVQFGYRCSLYPDDHCYYRTPHGA